MTPVAMSPWELISNHLNLGRVGCPRLQHSRQMRRERVPVLVAVAMSPQPLPHSLLRILTLWMLSQSRSSLGDNV